ncbi:MULTISPECIES: RHS repeat-associated core domain-containing protein [unclassified Streptomyces]|uniref:RHS repeat-associated core domain-containing protein n=1 Tax=unclassified Streptomyces TaxID=2593676 RepID=UPI0006F56BFE|nr:MULTISPECIES: RHS repeat-associated core domain-containing protein [unclassified Streptomyces]KQX50768.1 type IV secretion protein Rhs [Streptomyces sp. Root1304]KRA84933.1 type IV secretion protein Rhs [Streptomyces sp. Root66D1]
MAVTVPDWADTLLDLVGVNWPNVDEDAYREMADALREFADDLADDGQLANNHMERLLSSGHGEAMDALNAHWTKVKGKHLKDMVSAARTIADALDLAAGAIEGMKWKAVAELGVLAGQTGLAMALIPVTGGLSALLGAGAIALTKKQLLKLITAAMEEAVGHIVAVMTEPVVAALENMAADLVVQVSMDALGVQDGVDLNQTKQAGKDGFDEGVQGAKDGLNLASAGGGGGGGGRGGGKGFHIEHDEHDNAGTKLNGVSVGIHGKTAGKLTKAKGAQRRNKGRDDIADALDPVIEKAMGALVKSAKTMGDHVGETLPRAVKRISKDHKTNDDNIRDRLARERKDDDGKGKDSDGRGPGGKKGPGSDTRAKPEPLKDSKSDPRGKSVEIGDRTCEGDPVDIASGEMTMEQVDLSLAGVLPLVLRRTHLSTYRYGHWFGPSWASTLDERIEPAPSGQGAFWAREDGSVLWFPALPAPGAADPVLPVEGPRLALRHGEQDEAVTTYRVTDPRTGVVRTFAGSPYHESSAYWLTTIEDRGGNRISISRRGDGAPTAVSHSGGYLATLASEDGRVRELALRTPEGPRTVMRYGYDESGRLTQVVNSSDLPLRFTYDPDGRITSWTDRNGSTFRYVYDAEGRVARTIGPDGRLSSTFAYDVHPATGDRITRFTDSTGASKVYVLDDRLHVLAVTDPLGNTVRQTWDRHDRLATRTDPAGRTTAYTYDERGNLTGIAHPDGSSARVEYNELNQITVVTGPDGSVSRQEYDEDGNPSLFTRPNGTMTRLSYDARGRLTGVDDALGAVDRVENDPAGLPLAVRGRHGGVTRYVRDAFGRPVRITDPQGGSTELEWTVEGRLARRTDPDGATRSWAYDGEGNCVLHTDAMGGETRFEYTHFDLVSARTTPDGARHEFAHDTELRLTHVTNPQGLVWSYTYDRAGLLIAETDFDGRGIGYTYDAFGRLASRTNGAGQTVRYERDADGRLLLKDADGAVTRFGYDARGHLIGAVGPDSELSYVRDVSGRVLRETVDGRTLTRTYDEAGHRVRRTTPSGAVSSWSFAAGSTARLDTSGHRVDFEFDASGLETTRRFGTTLTIDHAYDAVGRLTGQHVRAAGSGLVQERAYTYRPDGHLTAVDDHLTGHRRLELSGEGRVTGLRAGKWTERYAYDEAGNQTHASWPGAGTAEGARAYDGTRITRAGGIRYEHDAQGRVVLRQKARLSRKPDTWRYDWDAEDRLIAVTTPDGTRWRYLYDALGRRTAKRRLADDGVTVVEETLFTWDGDTLCEQSTRAPGAPESVALTWDHDGSKPVTQVERRFLDGAEVDRRFFAIVTDLVGAPRELVDETGEIAWRTRATLWGTTTWNRDATAYTPLRFPGQYFDPESQLHYNRHRHYDPASGRYVSPDPLGLAPAPNSVAYVENPTRWIDPLGLAGCPHRGADKPRHSVVLGPNRPPTHASNELARYLRNDPDDPDHDPNRERDPGAHTYNGDAYAHGTPPDWMTNVSGAVGDRSTRLSITLDGMPNSRDEVGNWNTPETIVEAFQKAAAFGSQFNMSHEDNYPPAGVGGTAWEMSLVARAVRQYDGDAAWGEPDEERLGRPWEEIDWYSNNEKIDVPKPDIPEIKPDLSKLPKHMR